MKAKHFPVGTIFTIPHSGGAGDRVMLIKKNDCRLLVRPEARIHRTFSRAADGALVEFDAPASAYSISPETEVQ